MVCGCIEPRMFLVTVPCELPKGYKSISSRVMQKRLTHSVVDYLVSKGVDQNRLQAMGYGKSKPIASNATEEGRAENRRVELQIF
jgi:hypothetical protein